MKHGTEAATMGQDESPPSRGRGLKHQKAIQPVRLRHIAPFTGARIETAVPILSSRLPTSPPSRGRGLKPTVRAINISAAAKPNLGGEFPHGPRYQGHHDRVDRLDHRIACQDNNGTRAYGWRQLGPPDLIASHRRRPPAAPRPLAAGSTASGWSPHRRASPGSQQHRPAEHR